MGTFNGNVDDCALGALDVRLGIAEGEPVEVRVGHVVCFAAGTVDGAPDGVADGAADGFVLGADMAVAAGYPTGLAHSGGCIGTHVKNGKLPVWMHTAPGSQQSEDALHCEV